MNTNKILGAVVGDIVGLRYEFRPTKFMNFDLITPGSDVTDDSVVTSAVAKWLVEDEVQTTHYLIFCIQELDALYPDALNKRTVQRTPTFYA